MQEKDDIKVTAYNAETEPYRLVRLQRVIGYLAAASEGSGLDAISKIAALHDHKGCLQIEWRADPSEEEKIIAVRAWLSRIGDGADYVEHSVRSC